MMNQQTSYPHYATSFLSSIFSHPIVLSYLSSIIAYFYIISHHIIIMHDTALLLCIFVIKYIVTIVLHYHIIKSHNIITMYHATGTASAFWICIMVILCFHPKSCITTIVSCIVLTYHIIPHYVIMLLYLYVVIILISYDVLKIFLPYCCIITCICNCITTSYNVLIAILWLHTHHSMISVFSTYSCNIILLLHHIVILYCCKLLCFNNVTVLHTIYNMLMSFYLSGCSKCNVLMLCA